MSRWCIRQWGLLGLVVALWALPGPAEGERSATVERLLERLAAEGPASPYGGPLFPADLELVARESLRDRERLVVTGSFADAPRRQEVLDALRLEALLGALEAAGHRGGVEVLIRLEDGGLRPLGGEEEFLSLPHPSAQPLPASTTAPPSPFLLDLPLGGVLTGRRIGISAGHGWIDDGAGGWRTQRVRWAFDGCSSCRGITEDFFNAEIAARWVVPLLQRMGAEVVVVREPGFDAQTAVILDDGSPGLTETGPWVAGTSGDGYDTDYRTLAPGEVGTATYAFDATPAAWGQRQLALRYREGGNRTAAAVITLEHLGGTRTFLLDQRRVGRLWLDLGSAWLGPDSSLSLSPGATDGNLIADALKVGGGTYATSAKPWWEMAAASYVPFAGAPTAVTGLGDVTIRPAYAEYAGVDLYVSLHGNASGSAGGSSANGMSIYRYSCQTYADYSSSASASGCDDPVGSTRLMDLVHAAILERVRGDWDPNFGDRGRLVANFGELRVLDSTPGVLVEAAFFDNISSPSGSPPPRYPDNRSMHDPRWREAFARGLVAGIARYFDPAAEAPPDRPTLITARNRGDGQLEIGWEPVNGASRYLVQRAPLGAGRIGRAFDEGVPVDAPPLLLGNEVLEPGTAYAFRILAASADGLGLPSEAVVAAFRGAHDLPGAPVTSAQALVIQAYDRRDAWVQEIDNDGQHAIEHGEALTGLSAGDLIFDGATDEAVMAGVLVPGDYQLIDVVAGKNSTEHRSVKPQLRDALIQAQGSGSVLVLSGEELGYHLGGTSSDPADLAFLQDTLGVAYLADDANVFVLQPVAGELFDGLRSLDFDDGTAGVYEVRYPDVFGALGDARVVLAYPDGSGAAIARPGVYTFGVGLEAVVPTSSRRSIFERILGEALPDLPRGDLDLDGASDACEQQWGLDYLDGSDGALDPDQDGISSAQECQDGTPPVSGGLDGGNVTGDGGRPHQTLLVTGSCGCTSTDPEGALCWLLLPLGFALVKPRGRR